MKNCTSKTKTKFSSQPQSVHLAPLASPAPAGSPQPAPQRLPPLDHRSANCSPGGRPWGKRPGMAVGNSPGKRFAGPRPQTLLWQRVRCRLSNLKLHLVCSQLKKGKSSWDSDHHHRHRHRHRHHHHHHHHHHHDAKNFGDRKSKED